MEKEPIQNNENIDNDKENEQALTDQEMEDLYNDKDDDYEKPWQKIHNK